MDELLSRLVQLVSERWHSWTGLALALLAAALLCLVVLGAVKALDLTWQHGAFVLVSALVVLFLWVRSNRIPVTPRRKIGFVVAVTAESEQHARQLRDDFVLRLRSLLNTSDLKYPFELIEYTAPLAEQAVDFASAEYMLTRSRGTFMVFGRARSRQIGGGEAHHLVLEGLVRHRRVGDSTSKALRQDFRAVFPREVSFARENDVFSFKLTSEWLDVVARYIVGLAAMVSGDLEYAEGLLLSVRQRVTGAVGHVPQVARIRNLLPQRLAELYTLWLHRLALAYYLTRDHAHLQQAERLLDKRERIDPGNYSQKIFRAICSFVLRRDVRGAWRSIRECKGIRDATWRYSEAFLHAYEGNLAKALKSYRIAFKGTVGPTVPVESEEFIHIVLAEEPDKYQLYFCLGLLNFEVKEDYASARRDFNLFLGAVRDGEYEAEVEVAREYVYKCDEQLGRSSPGS